MSDLVPPSGKAARKRFLSVQNVTEEYLHSAAPGQGMLSFEEGYRRAGHAAEIDMATYLHDAFGGDIVLLKESEVKNQKKSDYLWNNKLWELKGTPSIDRADKLLQYAIKQIKDNPGGVILNMLANIDIQALEQQIIRRISRSRLDSLDVIIFLEGKLERVIRYKRK